MTWLLGIGLALGAAVAAIAGLAAWGSARWAASTRKLVRRLEAARMPATTLRYDARELEGLPPPVRRYFQIVLKDGQPIIRGVTMRHTGTFNLKQPGEQWKPFTSSQRVVTRRPGFVWNGRIAMAPGIAVYVHDAYVEGEGILNPAILGLYSLAEPVDARLLAEGEFIRFFAEAVWYPTALLSCQGVHWTPIDERSAQATQVDGPIRAQMRVVFNQGGLIESGHVEARAAMAGNAIVMMPWEVRVSNYHARDGMLVPMAGEAAWLRPEGRAPYWRGSITSLDYEFYGA